MSNQLIKLVGVSLLSSAIAACGGADKPSSSNSIVDSGSGVTPLENNYSLSLEGGNTGLCTSLALANCNNYFTYASSKIYSDAIPESSVAIAELPPKYVISQERIDNMETLIEGATWDADRLANMNQILGYLLENPQDAAGENIYDSIVKDAGTDNLRDFITNAVFDASGAYAEYGSEPAGFVTVIDGYEDAWNVLTDEEMAAFEAAVILGSEPTPITHTVSSEKIASLKASGLFDTAEKADLDSIFNDATLTALSAVEIGELQAAFNAIELGSERLVATTYTAQSVFDDLMVGYPDYPGEPDPLYSYLHLGSSSKYSLAQDDLDYMAGEIDTDAAIAADVKAKTIAVLKEVAKLNGTDFAYGDGQVYADRAAAYDALATAFKAVEVAELTGAGVFAAQEAHYPDYPGEPDDLYSHLHIGSQTKYSLVQEDFDYLQGESTASIALQVQTIAILKEIANTRTEYVYGAGEEFADRAAAYAQLSADFQAVALASINAFDIKTGASLYAGFNTLQKAAVTEYFVDRPSTRLREIAAVNDSTSAEAKGYFNNLVRDVVRMGGADAKVGIMTINNANPYDAYDAYASIFELAGIEVSWIPVDAASVIAQSEDNACGNLELEIAYQADQAALEVAYSDLYAQHLAACQDPSLITAKINDLDAIFITGGDQLLGMDALVDGGTDTEWFTALKTRYAAGDLLISGTSAGAAIAVDGNMFAGGSALEALQTTADLEANAGLGVFPYGILDTHTDERGRVARIAKALMQTNTVLGFGLSEASSLRVASVSATEVKMQVGGLGVYLVDATDALEAGSDITGLKLSHLSEGDVITLNPTTNAYTITLAASKSSANDAGFNVEAGGFTSSKDAFSSNAISKAIFGTYLDGYDDNPIALEGPLTDDAGADVTPEFSLTVTRDTNSVVAASGTGYQTFIGFTLDIESI